MGVSPSELNKIRKRLNDLAESNDALDAKQSEEIASLKDDLKKLNLNAKALFERIYGKVEYLGSEFGSLDSAFSGLKSSLPGEIASLKEGFKKLEDDLEKLKALLPVSGSPETKKE